MNDFSKQFLLLKKCFNHYDETSLRKKHSCLIQLSKSKIPLKKLKEYTDILLFICSHPHNRTIHFIVEKEFKRNINIIRKLRKPDLNKLENSGLPHTVTTGGYSQDLIGWMLSRKEYKLNLINFDESSESLNSIFNLTLPSLERENTSAGLSNSELFSALGIKKEKWLSFLIEQIEALRDQPLTKDFLYDSLSINVSVTPASGFFSIPYNRIKTKQPFYHDNLLRKFEHSELLNKGLPSQWEPNESEKDLLIAVIRNSFALTNRETDPSTYMDVNSLRLYELERGISIAIYGMNGNRQLPLESYVGYTLFKNGFPVAYGGAWLFGRRALFGINVFEPYRGGESGYILCQLLRVYRQVFSIEYFEVEPSQYGADNPEGIESGAFWFYYKYGFRPLDKALFKLAKSEQEKVKKSSGYRSSAKTLLRFTEDNIALNLSSGIPPSVPDYTSKVTSMIIKKYKGDRRLAVNDCILKLSKRLGELFDVLEEDERNVFEETALFAEVLNTSSPIIDDLLEQMIHNKPIDLYSYQKTLLALFKQIEKR